MKKVAVVGAGPAGLVSAKYIIAHGYKCDVYEQRGNFAGTWNIDTNDDYKKEKLRYTRLYQGIITNVPKELMMYSDYSYPPEEDSSYLGPTEVFNYFQGYADTFHLHPCIKYHAVVVNITTNIAETWSVTVKNLKTKKVETFVYDFVFVCNGRLWDPRIPDIPGRDIFEGTITHSSEYYEPSAYKDRKVVVVGGRTSARDIANFISIVAKHVFVSYRNFSIVRIENNVSSKPVIKELGNNFVIFQDESKEQVDDIIYCTGYNYKFPFLSSDCGITVESSHVNPLYHHIVNINHPTMYFIGVPSLVCAIPMFDLQVRFCIAAMNGRFKLPSKETMLEELKNEIVQKAKLKIPKKLFHSMGELQEVYWKKLATIASIDPLPSALCRLYEEVRNERKLEQRFRIVDDENFEIY